MIFLFINMKLEISITYHPRAIDKGKLTKGMSMNIIPMYLYDLENELGNSDDFKTTDDLHNKIKEVIKSVFLLFYL